MKTTGLICMLILGVFLAGAQEKKSTKQKKAEKQAMQIEQTRALVESNDFVFKARTANPMSGKTVNLTTEYDVAVRNDSVFCYLPYYGRAYIAAYGGESPMNFSLPVNDYTSVATKKGFRVNFFVRRGNDRIEFTFQIMKTGNTILQVNSTNRQSISYYGQLEKREKNDKRGG